MFIRLRMPATVQFKLRKSSKRANLAPYECYVTIRLTINSVRDAGFTAKYRYINQGDGSVSFGGMLTIDRRIWNQKTGQLRGRDILVQELNRALAGISIDLKDIQVKQQQRYDSLKAPRPTTDSVKFEYLSGFPPYIQGDAWAYPKAFLARKGKQNRADRLPLPMAQKSTAPLGPETPVIDALNAYLIELTLTKVASGKMAKQTFARRQCLRDWLMKYPPAELMPVASLTDIWVERFHDWLQLQPAGNPKHKFLGKRMNPGSATSYCSVLFELLDWLKKQHILTRNPLGNITEMDLPRFAQKDVIFLEPLHIERLFKLEPVAKLRVSHWWFRLICLTGMDYPDAVRYAKARAQYEAKSPGGNPKIVIRRAKTDAECNIPMTTRLFDLWDEVLGEAPYAVSDSTLINHLQEIGKAIGFEKRITPKVGRKTAGAIWLQDYSIKAVSNALGHGTVTITERYYVKVTGHTVDREMDTLSLIRKDNK